MPKTQPTDLALAAVLKREREARGESQETLAYKAGLSSSSLSAIELGRSSPAWPTVRAIIAAWGMSLAELAKAVEYDSRRPGALAGPSRARAGAPGSGR